ncbi:MAG: hypothetical protein JSW71_20245, partial [Gemmatimonadota bacterium]
VADTVGDFAYLYWPRFGYFIGDESGSGRHHYDAPEPGAMHQRLQGSEHDDLSWGARQLPSGMTLSRGTGTRPQLRAVQ